MNIIDKKRGLTLPDVLLLALILLVGAWVNKDTFLDIFTRVSIHGKYGFPFLVIAGSLYLSWLRRSRIQYLRYEPTFTGVVIIAIGFCSIQWAINRDILIAEHIGAMCVLIGAAVSMLGISFVRNFAAPLGALFLIIPVPGVVSDIIDIRLEAISATFLFSVFEIMNVPCQMLGNQLVIDGVSIKAGKEFNGYALMMSIAVVVYVFICAIPLRNGARLLILISSPLIALICNLICVLLVGICIGWFSPEAGLLIYEISAWTMLPVAVIILATALRIMFWLDIPVTTWRLVGSQ